MSKQFFAVIVVVILLFVGIFAFTGKKDDTKTTSSNSSALSQNVIGAGTTSVTLVEYGDYQCPYCQQYYNTVKQVQTEYGDKIKFQFRNFPLTSIHRNAFAASRAAEAAGKQNKYWEMHDILYENNDPNGAQGWVASNDATSYFDGFAKKIGLDVAKFKTDFASGAVNDTINADVAEGTKLGITGTPTFFVDGKKVTLSNSTTDFKKVIDAEIAKKTPAAAPAAEPAAQD